MIKDKKLKRNLVTLTCDFDYLAEQITLKFSSTFVAFRPKSLSVSFRKQAVTSMKFPSSNQFILKNEFFTTTASFSKVPIDFFGFSLDRIFSFELEFESNGPQTKLYKEWFKLTLPVVKQAELFFKPPGTTYPEPLTRRICAQAFEMTENNSPHEIQQCILLEEFKLMPIVERYEIYGYIKMLQLFLDIENSFELDLVQKFSQNNAEVKRQSAIHYKIDVSCCEFI